MKSKYILLSLFLLVVTMSACGTFELSNDVLVEAQLESTLQAGDTEALAQETELITADIQLSPDPIPSPENDNLQQPIAPTALQGYATYQNDEIGFGFSYPTNWYFETVNDDLLFVQSFQPQNGGSMGIPEGSTKIDLYIFPPGHDQNVSLDAFVATWREGGDTSAPSENQSEMLSEEYWVLSGELPVVRLHTEGLFGQAYMAYTQINGYGVQMVGYGDGNVFNQIAQTLQVTGPAQDSQGDAPVASALSGEWATHNLPDFGIALSVPAAWSSASVGHWHTFGYVSEPLQLEDQLVDVGLIPPGYLPDAAYPDANSYIDYFISLSEQAGFAGLYQEPIRVGDVDGTIIWNMPDTCSQVYFEANGLLLSITFHRPLCDGSNALTVDAKAILEQVEIYPPTDPVDLDALISGQP